MIKLTHYKNTDTYPILQDPSGNYWRIVSYNYLGQCYNCGKLKRNVDTNKTRGKIIGSLVSSTKTGKLYDVYINTLDNYLKYCKKKTKKLLFKHADTRVSWLSFTGDFEGWVRRIKRNSQDRLYFKEKKHPIFTLNNLINKRSGNYYLEFQNRKSFSRLNEYD